MDFMEQGSVCQLDYIDIFIWKEMVELKYNWGYFALAFSPKQEFLWKNGGKSL